MEQQIDEMNKIIYVKYLKQSAYVNKTPDQNDPGFTNYSKV